MKKVVWITLWIVCLLVNTLYLHVFDGFLILAGLCALIGLLLFALLKKKQKMQFSGKTAIFCITALFASMLVHSTLEESSKKRGTVIIQAISDYKKAHGELPQGLDNLVPAYMPEIPQTLMRIKGTAFFYLKQGEEYHLGFETAALAGYVYDSGEGEWQHRD